MEIGKKILKLRKDANLSQDQLAEQLEVTRQTISNWECGQTTPDIIQAKNIADIFNISLDELTENDVQNVIMERIKRTEKTTTMIKKGLKSLAIFIIAILIIVIIVTTFFILRKPTKAKYLLCTVGNNIYGYYISYNMLGDVYEITQNEILVREYSSKNSKENEKEKIKNKKMINDETLKINKYDFDKNGKIKGKKLKDITTDINNFYKKMGGTVREYASLELVNDFLESKNTSLVKEKLSYKLDEKEYNYEIEYYLDDNTINYIFVNTLEAQNIFDFDRYADGPKLIQDIKQYFMDRGAIDLQ